MVGLSEIRDSVQQISEAIASVLNVDVIVSDNEFRKIGDTKKHFDLEVKQIKDTYVLGTVLRAGETRVISGKDESENCVICDERDKCKLQAMICVPIKHDNHVIGAIGLIAITEASRTDLLENQTNLIEYVERMSDLIVSKLMEKEVTEKLTVAKNQLISIMDSIEEGIAAVDESGSIVYLNSILEDILNEKRDSLIDRNIVDVFPGPYVSTLLRDGTPFNNIELRIKSSKGEVHALISGRPVALGEKNAGSILAFKKMDDVYEIINNLTASNRSTSFDEIVSCSPQIVQLKEKALKVAKGSSNILITGESGTGKELFARAIHFTSPRSTKPFIALNCAAMPETLIESELFGYEEGSFTGASRGGRPGKFQLAHGGTIFLDEIGDMPLHLQPKLLRVLQEKTVEKIGSHKSVAVDVRVIAATNKDLEKMVDRGEFREDLYYRLNVIPLHIPPLRERTGDIRLLLSYLLKQYNSKLDKQIKGFSANAEHALLNCQWKGNVRELANVVEYSVNMETTGYITVGSLPYKIRAAEEEPIGMPKVKGLRKTENEMIREALSKYGDSVPGKRMAAETLGISLSTLYRKMKELDFS
jgi:sigma-54 dependent transcriptional regulator, acetoin dehydrogenase operon transcriptional activator AcoR